MREALGLSLKDSPETAIQRYYTLYKLLNQAEITTNKLSKNEKLLTKRHKKISQDVSKLKSLIDDKINYRISDKKFDKEYKKISNHLQKILKKIFT